MNHSSSYSLTALGLCCALGMDKSSVVAAMFRGETSGMVRDHDLLSTGCYLGRVNGDLLEIPAQYPQYQSRNNQLLLTAYAQIQTEIEQAIRTYGHDRVAVMIGTSTSGIDEGEQALEHYFQHGVFPPAYAFSVQTIGNAAEFLAEYLGLSNLATTISTACSSSAKTFASAAELLEMNICDAVLVGGVDSLCRMTVNGFHALGVLSPELCNPFSINRAGISIGEGAALFLMTRATDGIQFLSVGESSDAYSMTAPEPEGEGAAAAMQDALQKAGIAPSMVDYINLHGTGTLHNDSMESKAVSRIFGPHIACSSTKPLTGHTLGAAGAIEAALCWLLLSETYNPDHQLPPHYWDAQKAPDILLENFVATGQIYPRVLRYTASNSFAFGGSNTCVLLKRASA